MKRVILFDLDTATLEDCSIIQKEIDKKKKQLEKDEKAEEETAAKEERYKNFIASAVDCYIEGENTLKEALSEAYDDEYDIWVEFDPNLSFGDDPPCIIDDCWCSGNLDRVGGLTFYYNIFNEDIVVCDVGLGNRKAPEFDQVFETILEDAESDMKKILNPP